jgi:hypothetical protein
MKLNLMFCVLIRHEGFLFQQFHLFKEEPSGSQAAEPAHHT